MGCSQGQAWEGSGEWGQARWRKRTRRGTVGIEEHWGRVETSCSGNFLHSMRVALLRPLVEDVEPELAVFCSQARISGLHKKKKKKRKNNFYLSPWNKKKKPRCICVIIRSWHCLLFLSLLQAVCMGWVSVSCHWNSSISIWIHIFSVTHFRTAHNNLSCPLLAALWICKLSQLSDSSRNMLPKQRSTSSGWRSKLGVYCLGHFICLILSAWLYLVKIDAPEAGFYTSGWGITPWLLVCVDQCEATLGDRTGASGELVRFWLPSLTRFRIFPYLTGSSCQVILVLISLTVCKLSPPVAAQVVTSVCIHYPVKILLKTFVNK